ncbi:hypothetical protein J0S82_013010, partial [Galemys pyrenaicus]
RCCQRFIKINIILCFGGNLECVAWRARSGCSPVALQRKISSPQRSLNKLRENQEHLEFCKAKSNMILTRKNHLLLTTACHKHGWEELVFYSGNGNQNHDSMEELTPS